MDLGKEKNGCLLISFNYSYNFLRSNCVGMRFALLEAKIAMAKALRVVEFQKCEKTEVRDDIFVLSFSHRFDL